MLSQQVRLARMGKRNRTPRIQHGTFRRESETNEIESCIDVKPVSTDVSTSISVDACLNCLSHCDAYGVPTMLLLHWVDGAMNHNKIARFEVQVSFWKAGASLKIRQNRDRLFYRNPRLVSCAYQISRQ